ncbi:MAG: FGGY-family carbohydrate kinase [Rhodospirillaceae bacterium]|nr:FGGY-family carbohydrate kinase [Rhodospirillaceae bacterium]
MRYYLGVDIGTFESKGVLTDGDGQIKAIAKQPHKMLVPQAGWAEHRPLEDWWGDFTAITRELLETSGVAPGDIRAVACSAIGPCMLPVDENGEALMNAVLYGVDNRAHAEVKALTAEIGEDRLLDLCGNTLTSQSVGPKILWLQNERAKIYRKAHRILTSTSYLVHQLTGRFVIDHYSASNFSPLYDIGACNWTDGLTDRIMELERLPDLYWSTDIVGHVTAAAAKATGLAVGTPVTAGTIDAAAEAVSVGVREPGDMMVMYGSTIFIVQVTETRLRDPRLWHGPWLFEGGYSSTSGLSTSGTLTHWFRDQLAQDLTVEAAFPELAAEAAASPPGAKGLVMLPYFSGERTPIHDPNAKGVLFGMNLTHTRGDIYRALLEGIAYATNHIFETYAEAGQVPKRVLAVGGGTKNEVWAQSTSNVSGIDQTLRRETIGASYGDAFLAALAVGDVRQGDIEAWNPETSKISAQPDESLSKGYSVFRRLYEQTKDLMAELE